jgi:hypothetical protein
MILLIFLLKFDKCTCAVSCLELVVHLRHTFLVVASKLCVQNFSAKKSDVNVEIDSNEDNATNFSE